MKISRRSWHYRWMAWQDMEPPGYTSLCRYFWRFVGVCLVDLFAVGMSAVVIIALSVLAWAVWTNVPGVRLGTTAGVSTLALITGIIAAKLRWDQRRREYREPNLFVAYVKATKQKICPLIEWTDD